MRWTVGSRQWGVVLKEAEARNKKRITNRRISNVEVEKANKVSINIPSF